MHPCSYMTNCTRTQTDRKTPSSHTHVLCLHSPALRPRITRATIPTRIDWACGTLRHCPRVPSGCGQQPYSQAHLLEGHLPPYLSARRCSPFFTHLRRQQVRKAMDMSRMMAQLTMEAITATLKPKVSCGGTARRRKPPGPGTWALDNQDRFCLCYTCSWTTRKCTFLP